MYSLQPEPKKSGCLGNLVKVALIIFGLLVALVVLVAIFGPKTTTSTGTLETQSKQVASTPQATVAAAVAVATDTPVIAPTAVDTTSYVSFNQLPNLDAGAQNAVSIVKVGKIKALFNSTTIPVIVRNNTAAPVKRVEISAVASDAAGKMLASGGTQMVTPNLVNPGQLTLTYVYFSDVELPQDASIKYEITSQDYGKLENIRDLPVKEHNLVENRIVGLLVNSYDVIVDGPIGVNAYCFDDQSNLIKQFSSYTQKDTANPGDTIPFQVNIEQPCAYYLISASGFTKL